MTSLSNDTQTRITTILSTLKQTYPDAHIILTYRTSWELLVAVILSAQCTDAVVNRVTHRLFAKYKTLSDYVNADRAVFEADIKSTGFYRNKARNILSAATLIKEKFNSQVPRTMDELLSVPGVARKTANVVLGNAYGVVVGIAVDTHVLRLAQRLRLVDLDTIGGKKAVKLTKPSPGRRKGAGRELVDYKKDADPVKIEMQLMAAIPRDLWFTTTYLLIDHGRATCRAQKPDCMHCVVSAYCPVSRN